MADLITLDEYAQATGQTVADLEQAEKDRIAWAITAATTAVRSYADRDFVLIDDADQGPRQFRYEGCGALDIDDCVAINSISTVQTNFASSRTLDSSEYFAQAFSPAQVIESVEFYTSFLPTGVSPAMGFKRNLDTYPFVPYPQVISIDALWGWVEIPSPVKQATVWTVAEMMTEPAPYNAEAIAGYSRSYAASRGSILPGQIVQAVPDRAAALLDPYTRWAV